MYLEEQNSDLNDEINDLICLSNDLTSIEDRLAVKLKAWSLIPEPKINWVEPTSSGTMSLMRVQQEHSSDTVLEQVYAQPAREDH